MPNSMSNTEPMSSSNPVVENKPTPDFSERLLSERLTKSIAIMEDAQMIINTVKIPTRKGVMLSGEKFDKSGVRVESAVQSPFQSGKMLYRKSVSEVKTVIITAATEITPPAIPIINP